MRAAAFAAAAEGQRGVRRAARRSAGTNAQTWARSGHPRDSAAVPALRLRRRGRGGGGDSCREATRTCGAAWRSRSAAQSRLLATAGRSDCSRCGMDVFHAFALRSRVPLTCTQGASHV
eukprot:75297-Chlamydomonas_euryale.AAC.4